MTTFDPRRLRWPLPALLVWGLAWGVFTALGAAGLGRGPASAAALLAGVAGAAGAAGTWRRLMVAAGFPLSALALGGLTAWPPWAWAMAALALLLAYPLRAWRDAPFFPTPARALDGLERAVALPAGGRGAQVLDAGCGLGHGLRALRRLWPDARFEGVEWSRPLAWLATGRCRFARVRRGDLWADSWAAFDLVYLFQRPESMARAWAKAEREMRPGAWLVSLEFPVPGQPEAARVGARPAWVYRVGAAAVNSRSTDAAVRR